MGATRARLAAAGVEGVEDLGRFVSKPEFFGESRFDERAAMPILIEALPNLMDPKLIGAVAGHLRRPWARPHAFDALLAAFEGMAPGDDSATGWHLGDAIGATATAKQVESLLRIGRDRKYGTARQMVVHALSRFKKAPEVQETLLGLIEDPDSPYTQWGRSDVCLALVKLSHTSNAWNGSIEERPWETKQPGK